RVVEEVLHAHRERQVVAVLRAIAAEGLTAAPSAAASAAAATTAAASATTATTAAARAAGSGRGHLAEADGLTEAHVDGEEAGAAPVVARDDHLPGLRGEVEVAEGRPAHARAREVCGEGGPHGEARVAVQVAREWGVAGPA